jgi:hypothetical protein
MADLTGTYGPETKNDSSGFLSRPPDPPTRRH